MKSKFYTIYLLFLIALTSCEPTCWYPTAPFAHLIVSGTVQNEEGMPLENIKITIGDCYFNEDFNYIVYTDSNGSFKTPKEKIMPVNSVSICAEDPSNIYVKDSIHKEIVHYIRCIELGCDWDGVVIADFNLSKK